MDKYLNAGVVNEENLPSIIPLPCPIQVLTEAFAKISCFYP